ncbi:MAG: class II aldolase/adducin family protein [Actinomycetota bacterium]
MKYQAERESVIRHAVEMEDRDLTIGTSGNVSMRVPEGAIITPSTIPYREIAPEDCVLMDLDGGVIEGEKVPSVEHKVHLECYKARAEVNGVIHAHPTVASAFASARVPLPAFLDEFGVYVGDEVRVAEYAISGTPEIAKSAVETMGETANAVFLASHGMVCVGRDLPSAMHVARQVERGAQIYLWTKMLGGPADLPDDAKNLFAQVFAFYRTR